MASLFLFLTAALLAGAWADNCDCSAGDGLLRARADRNQLEIQRLSRLIDSMKHKAHVDDAADLGNLKARVERIVGNSCEDDQFQCADHVGCVNSALVCDGVSDCADGSDETDHTCDNPITVGSSWSAHVNDVTCFRHAANHVRMMINKVDRSEFAPSKVHLSVTTFLYKLDGSYSMGNAEGYYSFGNRQLYLRATDGDVLDFHCDFRSNNDSHCHGTFSRGSGHSCEAVAKRE